MKCSYCGYDNAEGSRFCSGCGRKLDNREQQTAEGVKENNIPEYTGQQQYQQPVYQNIREERNSRPQPEIPRKPEKSRSAAGPAGRRSREEKKIILIGVILACVVVAAGVTAYLLLSRYMKNGDGEDPSAAAAVTSASSSSNEKTEKKPEKTPTAAPEPTEKPEKTPTATPEPTPTEIPLSVSLVDADQADMTGYSKAGVKEAAASSVVDQEGYDNTAAMAVDGNVVTSWQEGADGDGIGEFLNLKLDREYDVRYITLNLGNWRDQQRYDENNVPKTLTIWLDEKSFTIDFPYEKTQFCLEFSKDCPASEIYVRIDDVYEGALWDDTCISEIGIYGA